MPQWPAQRARRARGGPARSFSETSGGRLERNVRESQRTEGEDDDGGANVVDAGDDGGEIGEDGGSVDEGEGRGVEKIEDCGCGKSRKKSGGPEDEDGDDGISTSLLSRWERQGEWAVKGV